MKQQRVHTPRRHGRAANATKERRFALRLTMSEVAKRAGMSLTKVSQIERGLRLNPADLAAIDAAMTALAAAVRP